MTQIDPLRLAAFRARAALLTERDARLLVGVHQAFFQQPEADRATRPTMLDVQALAEPDVSVRSVERTTTPPHCWLQVSIAFDALEEFALDILFSFDSVTWEGRLAEEV